MSAVFEFQSSHIIFFRRSIPPTRTHAFLPVYMLHFKQIVGTEAWKTSVLLQ
jgi:hypothetical protein